MISYHYIPKFKPLSLFLGKYFSWVLNGKLKVWIDSGAFSAFKKGITINLFEYSAWLHENNQYIHKYMALDDIIDPSLTLFNYETMLESGLNPIPVFHRFDPMDLLDFYVANTDYIALGTRAPFNDDEQRREWLLRVMDRHFAVNYHCLGFIKSPLLQEFNFDSCDSCTWEIDLASATRCNSGINLVTL